jgi:hypothetical protein
VSAVAPDASKQDEPPGHDESQAPVEQTPGTQRLLPGVVVRQQLSKPWEFAVHGQKY